MDPQRRPTWSPFFNAECAVAAHSRPTLTGSTYMPYILAIPKIARWIVLAILVVTMLFFLNDAFFSGWVAGGPPGPHKLGWERRALSSLLLSGAALFGAIGTFRALGRLPRIGVVSWVLLALAASLTLTPFIIREVLVDQCLDSGGSWSHTFLECEL